MSEYPRSIVRKQATVFIPDRVTAVVKGLAWLYSTFSYYFSFSRRWSLYGAGRSIWEYAPPLAEHLSSQIIFLLTGLYVLFGIWFGRGWAFACTFVTCFSACVLTLLVHGSMLYKGISGFIYLPIGLYCALRLLGTLGPPVGGFELRRRVPETEEPA